MKTAIVKLMEAAADDYLRSRYDVPPVGTKSVAPGDLLWHPLTGPAVAETTPGDLRPGDVIEVQLFPKSRNLGRPPEVQG